MKLISELYLMCGLEFLTSKQIHNMYVVTSSIQRVYIAIVDSYRTEGMWKQTEILIKSILLDRHHLQSSDLNRVPFYQI